MNKNKVVHLILLVVLAGGFAYLLVPLPWVLPACGLRVVVDVVAEIG